MLDFTSERRAQKCTVCLRISPLTALSSYRRKLLTLDCEAVRGQREENSKAYQVCAENVSHRT